MASEGQFKVIGSRPLRPDGVDKVTGRAVYGNDTQMSGMLYGVVLRSPHGHARIRNIDTSKAEALPGVRAVVTGADLPQLGDVIEELGEGGSANMRYASNNVLAGDKALYDGHAVAAVAAVDLGTAENAAALIEVDYEVLSAVLTVQEAMADGAAILHPELRTDGLGEQADAETNVAAHFRHQLGDIEQGFAEADVVIEREFDTATVHQGYIEPHASTAQWNQDGQLTVWTSTQGAFAARGQLASILDKPVSEITVVPTEIGGGFGGKIPVYVEPVAAILSREAGHKPVKVCMSRTDVIKATGPTSGSHIKVKMGATKDGHITAAEVSMAYEAGGYPGSPVPSGSLVILAPYKIPHVTLDGYDVLVNKPKASPYRAPGGTNAAFASETVVDELARAVAMCPLEFRMLNAVEEGDRQVNGLPHGRVGLKETLEMAIDHPHFATPLEGANRGRGVAAGYWMNWGGKSSASAHVNGDGSVNLMEGSTDIGGTRASIAMQLAETLEIPYEQINTRVADTGAVGYTDLTGGSRTTAVTGMAVHELGVVLKEEMTRRAADLMEVDASEVSYRDGVFSHNGTSMPFNEVAQKADAAGEPIVGTASVAPPEWGAAFGVHIVDIEVDPDTGKVDILRYTALQNVGKAIHPSYVEGQIQGGVAQGIGWALNEEYIYSEDGRLLNASLLDYRMPTALDLPMIETVLVEVPWPDHPYGVRGCGETPIVPPAGALAAALHDALGIRPTELPMSPGKVLELQNGGA
ncbi:MAG: xanthine dehydrogenase family protein molybdopterin-binding subunit [Caldilineaceae bacterium SB0666_bin_21]|nr:xanthine dehydrogenase family protein molybdopterin-binding subunit [Caldilineaceae bacterium SB0666_bin_21]